nr:MAG TPA: hypothetical protein [Caudoviricetes sp.]
MQKSVAALAVVGFMRGGSWQRSTYSGKVYIPLDRHSL